MKYCKIFVLVITTVVLVFSGCSGSSSDGYNAGNIGPSSVGIVFRVTDGGLHGMEVSTVDLTTTSKWSNITDSFANGSSALPPDIGKGLENTISILAQAGHTSSAAQLCRDYRSTLERDWYLPSLDELVLVDDNMPRPNLVDFPDKNHVSSTENTAAVVYSLYFGSPSHPISTWISAARSKCRNDGLVRAVRIF